MSSPNYLYDIQIMFYLGHSVGITSWLYNDMRSNDRVQHITDISLASQKVREK